MKSRKKGGCSWMNALCYNSRQHLSGARLGHGQAVSDQLGASAKQQILAKHRPPQPGSFSKVHSLYTRVKWGDSSLAQRGSHVPGVRQCDSGQGGLAQCHQSRVRLRGCFSGSWMMTGLLAQPFGMPIPSCCLVTPGTP